MTAFSECLATADVHPWAQSYTKNSHVDFVRVTIVNNTYVRVKYDHPNYRAWLGESR